MDFKRGGEIALNYEQQKRRTKEIEPLNSSYIHTITQICGLKKTKQNYYKNRVKIDPCQEGNNLDQRWYI